MIGAIAGDIIGSIYERRPIKTKKFPLFGEDSGITDDSVLTVAVADVLLNGGDYAERFREYYRRYPDCGFGGMFHRWAQAKEAKPYNSFGNGSAMRVSPAAYVFDRIEQVRAEAARSAEVTHNHPEGMKGAEAIAAAVFLARGPVAKAEIRQYVEREFGYDLSQTPDEIRPSYKFDVTCQGTVPAAVSSFLHADNFEDAVRTAVSLGGDSDTLACIAGSMAGAYYGVPAVIEREVWARMDEQLSAVVKEFMARFGVTGRTD